MSGISMVVSNMKIKTKIIIEIKNESIRGKTPISCLVKKKFYNNWNFHQSLFKTLEAGAVRFLGSILKIKWNDYQPSIYKKFFRPYYK